MRAWAESFSPFAVHLTPEPVESDSIYAVKSRLGIIKSKSIEGAPDLIVEALSP